MAVDVARGAELHDPSAVHDRDPVGDAQRLVGIVRHVQRTDTGVTDEAGDVQSQFFAQDRIERTVRFVQQDDLRLRRAARQSHTP